MTVSHKNQLSYDPNWEWQEFKYDEDDQKMIKWNEHRSEGKHSMQVYD